MLASRHVVLVSCPIPQTVWSHFRLLRWLARSLLVGAVGVGSCEGIVRVKWFCRCLCNPFRGSCVLHAPMSGTLRVIHPLILILLILPPSYSFNFIFIHSRSNSLIPIQTHSYSFKLHSYFSLMFTHTHSYSLKMFTITASPRHARTQSVSHARTHAFALSLTHPLRQCVRSCCGRCLGSLAVFFFNN